MSVLMRMKEPRTICIVEADEAVRDSLRLLLRSVHLTSRGYPSLEAFLREYEPNSTGCLILDVSPTLGSAEWVRALAPHPELPVVLMSTTELPSRAERPAGILEALTKPFTDVALLEAINPSVGSTKSIAQ